MRQLAMIAASFLLLLLSSPTLADVDVEIEYDKLKEIDKTVAIDITKTIDIAVVVNVTASQTAEAEALINQENFSNEACENCAEKRDRITDSLTGNNGVIDVNQAAGNMNNQGNAIAISVDDRTITPDDPGTPLKEGQVFADAQAAVEQNNGVDKVTDPSDETVFVAAPNLVDATNLLEKSAVITGSLNDNNGVVHVNQATGNMYNQANALAMAVGFGSGGVALAESDLGQKNSFNTVNEAGEAGAGESSIINKFAEINGSVNGNSGVVGVNQGVGNMGNQANIVSFAVIVGGSGNGNGAGATTGL